MRDGKIVAAVTGMDHGHINGMTEGIGEAGAVIKWAYDPDMEKTKSPAEALPCTTANLRPNIVS